MLVPKDHIIKIETKRECSKNKTQRASQYPEGQEGKSGERTTLPLHPPFTISGSDWLEELPNHKCKWWPSCYHSDRQDEERHVKSAQPLLAHLSWCSTEKRKQRNRKRNVKKADVCATTQKWVLPYIPIHRRQLSTHLSNMYWIPAVHQALCLQRWQGGPLPLQLCICSHTTKFWPTNADTRNVSNLLHPVF